MPYITREDGEHFVIPSYRDVLSVKQKTQLKKDILLLSQSYGDYITLQKKNAAQYEVAFSPDTGYLLGESIWHHFKRPMDMVYCEAIPNTTEAILVIVKSGSVYLDGRFPLESIPEELIIFLTQQNNFEIYIYGDVPISEHPEDGKFSFDPSSVKSFSVLPEPIFPTLPLLKMYQLQLVDQVLKAHGIGVMPIKQIIGLVAILGVAWLGWWYFTRPEVAETLPVVRTNPYQKYVDLLKSPPPEMEVNAFLTIYQQLLALPGWNVTTLDYSKGSMMAKVQSAGGTAEGLNTWAQANNMMMDIKSDGIYLTSNAQLPSRKAPTKIYPLKDVIAILIDRMAKVYPGNQFRLAEINNRGNYSDTVITINLTTATPAVIGAIGQQLQGLPFILQNINGRVTGGVFSGNIIIQALGT